MGGSGGRRAPVSVDDSSNGIINIIQSALDVQSDSKSSKSISEFEKAFASTNNACIFTSFDGEMLPW